VVQAIESVAACRLLARTAGLIGLLKLVRQGTSHTRDLREMVEVSIAGEEMEAVLHGKGRRPEVVRRDGRALRAELAEDARVVVRRLVIRVQHLDARDGKEPCEIALVPQRA
jgi:hypothetical protein